MAGLVVAAATLIGSVIAGPGGAPTYHAPAPAPAPVVEIDGEPVPFALDLSIWSDLKFCESGTRSWHDPTTSGFWAALQFAPSTWRAYGSDFAPTAMDATVAEQIEVGRRVLDAQGWRAWPGCSRKLGYR